MSKKFTVELSLGEAADQAQARAATALKKPAEELGLRLKGSVGEELSFEPSWGFPFLINTWRHLDHQHMSVRFEAAGDGSRVTISGAVSAGKHAQADSEDFWRQALGS